MENLLNPLKNNPDGFSENFLRDAYENIFNDSSHFYSLLYNHFDDKSDMVSDISQHISVRSNNLKTQTINKLKTVIMADDDEDDRIFFKEALQESKIITKIILVKDGAELMDHISSKGHPLPHIIFLDLNMPKKTGKECLVELRKNDQLKNIPIAIYTTSVSEEDIKETYLKGANIYIKKPNNFSVIKKILREVVSMDWDLQRRNLDNYFINSVYQ